MAGNSKDSKILAYKDMINQLNKTISTQTELIQSLQKTLEADRLEKENLHQQIEYLTKKLFGTSSEKRKNIDGQLNLFDEAEQEADPTWEQELPDDITVPEHKRKMSRSVILKRIPGCGSSAVENMDFRRSSSTITQRQGQSSMQHLSYRGSADIWRQMDTRVIIICRISNAALAGHM